MVSTVITWMLGIVAAVSFVAGPQAAAGVAGNTLRTVGITVGAVAGGADNLIKGFNDARSVQGNPGNGAPLSGLGATSHHKHHAKKH